MQPTPEQPAPDQPYAYQPTPEQPTPEQPTPEQPYPGQPYPGQPGAGQRYTAPRYPTQPGQPYPPRYDQPKDWFVTLLLAIFLGNFGVHRFYTGRIATGLLMLFTFGGCGVWWLVDIILVATGAYTDAFDQPLVHTI